MPWERDVGAFDERADRYDSGWRAKMHHEIVLRTIDIALSLEPAPKRVLDIGCGTGVLLGSLADRLPDASLAGIDAAPRMVDAARNTYGKLGIETTDGVAESLPFGTREFDLVVSTTSFDHWEDQQQGLLECARVLRTSGHFVCVDQFSLLLWPTLLVSRKGKTRTKRRLKGLVDQTSFRELRWHDIYTALIKGFSVTV